MIDSETLLTKEEIMEIDKKLPLIPVYFDPIFKGVFLSNLEIFKDFILTVLKLDLKPEDCTIKVLNSALLKRVYKEYQKTADIIVSLTDDLHVIVEINNESYKYVQFRNDAYTDQVYSALVKSGEKMEMFKVKKLYQLNLNVLGLNDGEKDGLVVPYDLVKNEIHSDNKVIVLKYLENYEQEFYNGNREKDVCLLASLLAKSFTEFYERLEGAVSDEARDKLVRRLIEMSGDIFNIELWDAETTNKFIEMNKKADLEAKATADGMAKGIAQGMARGRSEGIKETKIETAKSMLKENLDYELITKITGLTTKEIEKIKNNENL